MRHRFLFNQEHPDPDHVPQSAPCMYGPEDAVIVDGSYESPANPMVFPFGSDLFRCPDNHEFRLHRYPGMEWVGPDWIELAEFDRERAHKERDVAIARANNAAPIEWKDRAYQVIEELAYAQANLTSDHVWACIEKPREPRALGAIFQKAARNGLIFSTGRFLQSERPEAHSMDIRVWESKVHGQKAVQESLA